MQHNTFQFFQTVGWLVGWLMMVTAFIRYIYEALKEVLCDYVADHEDSFRGSNLEFNLGSNL